MNLLILKFPYSSTLGGGEKHTITLTENLKKNGHQVYLVSSCPVLINEFSKRNWQNQQSTIGKDPVSAKTVLFFILCAPYRWFQLSRILIKYKLSYKIEAIYCLSLNEKILITPLARLLKLKVFWVEHVMIDKWLTKNPLRILYRINSRWTQIITVSQAIKTQLEKIKINPDRIKTIHNGIVVPLLPPKQNSEEFYKKRFIVGTVCRLHQEKGLKTLLLAIKIASEIIENLYVIIVGDGPEKEKLIWLAKQLNIQDKIRFTGWQNEVGTWIKQFDLFVLPSLRESFGMVILEAYAYKKAVIASKVGGINEIMADKQTGMLIEPNNPEMLAQGIINLQRNPKWRISLGENGYKLLRKNFTQEKMIAAYEKLFNI